MIIVLHNFEGHNHFEGGVIDFRSQKQPGERVEGVVKTFLPPSPSRSLHFSISRPRAAK